MDRQTNTNANSNKHTNIRLIQLIKKNLLLFSQLIDRVEIAAGGNLLFGNESTYFLLPLSVLHSLSSVCLMCISKELFPKLLRMKESLPIVHSDRLLYPLELWLLSDLLLLCRGDCGVRGLLVPLLLIVLCYCCNLQLVRIVVRRNGRFLEDLKSVFETFHAKLLCCWHHRWIVEWDEAIHCYSGSCCLYITVMLVRMHLLH